MLQRYLPHCCT